MIKRQAFNTKFIIICKKNYRKRWRINRELDVGGRIIVVETAGKKSRPLICEDRAVKKDTTDVIIIDYKRMQYAKERRIKGRAQRV